MRDLISLSNSTTEVVVDVTTGVPTVLHWGAPLGRGVDLSATLRALDRPRANGTLDVIAPISIVPEHGSGFHGRPGLLGRRGGGVAWSPRFALVGAPIVSAEPGASVPGTNAPGWRGGSIVAVAEDDVAELRLTATIRLDDALHVQVELTNLGQRRYSLDGLTVTLPLPEHAAELQRFDGRWAREFHAERVAWPGGAVTSENRRGRTSHENPPLMFAGETAFGEWCGEVWGVHVAWSGNHTMLAERLDDGRRYIQVGELLHPGEIVLEAGETYTTPELIGVYSAAGLTPAAWGFHRSLRARTTHPARPRPVTLSTWEAVYFDHDHERLVALADAAAAVGIERYVLDDGWFGSRRDDTSGLGDWVVSPDVYPNGLAPLIEHVTGLGMEFGIWVEPEMVNADSDLARAHPDWTLASEGYEPIVGRDQLVLDLARPEAFAHVLGQLDALLRDHDIAFVKWDMNRAHAQGAGASGAAGTHRQTLALYALLDELRSMHPAVEFESCASGGGRVDHEILRRTERVWTSDCNDALERQQIQRGASMLIPPEMTGAHIGPSRSHTTGRIHSLAFRGATAMFGHLGVEWDIARLDNDRRAELRETIEIHKTHRALLHGGDTVRFDTGSDAHLAHGVYAPDRSRAIVSFVQMATAPSLTPPPLRLPGLDPDRCYELAHLRLPGERWGMAIEQPRWITEGGLVLTGRQLDVHGIQPPILHPESAILVALTATA
jgi:alpha-galactosidase